jgi:hypothetical protein
VETELFKIYQFDRKDFELLPLLQDEIKSGSYQLLMEMSNDVEIRIGKLGLLQFPRGYYLYTGVHRTAMINRVVRHLSHSKNSLAYRLFDHSSCRANSQSYTLPG